jgi:hypothetical protein
MQNRNFFFSLILKSSFFIIIILILFGCKTIKTNHSFINEIGFGSGGGFTGQYIDYTLNLKGELYKYNKSKKMNDFLKKIDLTKTKEIFKKVENENLFNYKYNISGNMNKYIEIRTKNGFNKILWCNSDKLQVESVKSVYQELNFFLK